MGLQSDSSEHRRTRLSSQAGMTMLEIMLVLAIIAGLMALFSGNMLKTDATRLREASSELMTTLRTTHNMATMTGKHHRVVIDLEAQLYHIEVCAGKQVLVRGDEEHEVDMDAVEKLREKMKEKANQQVENDIMEAESPEDAFASAAALEGLRVGGTRCHPVGTNFSGQKAKDGNRHKLDTKHGVEVKIVHVQHLADPVEDSKVTINFFPVGSAEKAVVEIGNNDDSFSILVHGMTSRIVMKKGSVDADDHLHRNGLGDEEEKR